MAGQIPQTSCGMGHLSPSHERTARGRIQARNGKLVEDIIPVLDDFERSINYANENGEEGLLGGVTAVYAKLNEVLVKEGVEIIDPVGQPYEALEAQAVATVDNPNVPDETVEQVYQKGYRIGNKVIRPAMVTVAVGGPKRETDEEEDNE